MGHDLQSCKAEGATVIPTVVAAAIGLIFAAGVLVTTGQPAFGYGGLMLGTGWLGIVYRALTRQKEIH